MREKQRGRSGPHERRRGTGSLVDAHLYTIRRGVAAAGELCQGFDLALRTGCARLAQLDPYEMHWAEERMERRIRHVGFEVGEHIQDVPNDNRGLGRNEYTAVLSPVDEDRSVHAIARNHASVEWIELYHPAFGSNAH